MADPISGPGGITPAAAGIRVGGPGPTGEVAHAFGDYLRQAMTSLQSDNALAQGLQNTFAAGGPVDISQVTVAMEQSSLAMQLLVEVRNQLLTAYDTLMRMPV